MFKIQIFKHALQKINPNKVILCKGKYCKKYNESMKKEIMKNDIEIKYCECMGKCKKAPNLIFKTEKKNLKLNEKNFRKCNRK